MKKQDVQISIIVPIYKVEKYLVRCVESLLAQDFPPLEIILIDDGSPDRCGEICDNYAKKDARIIAYHKPNGGLSDARNYGLERAHGEYVLFVDSDDYLEPQACANLWKEARAGFADIIISKMALEKPSEGMARFEKVAEDRFQYHRIYSGPAYLMGCLEGGALRVEVIRTMFRRDFLVRNDLYFEYGILHEDEEFTPRALLKAERVVLTDYVYYHYDNSRSDSIMNSTALNAKKIADRVKIYDGLRKLYKTVKPRKLRRLLEDDLSWKYIDCYCASEPKSRKKLGVKRLVVLKCAYKARRRAKALVFALAPNRYANRMREQALVRKVHQRRSSSKALPIEREPAKNIKHTEKKAGKSRLKKGMKFLAKFLFLILLLAGGLAKNIYDNRTNYTAEFYQVSSRKLTHSIRVAFLTDVHLREYGMDNGDLVEDIENLSPDLILLGGDLVKDTVDSYDNMISLCSQLTEIAPVCGVLGNHEDVKIYHQGDEELVKRFEDAGVKILRNEETSYSLYDNTVSVIGIEGKPEDFASYGAKECMEAQEAEDQYDLRICIAHVPTYFPEKLENYSFDLGLAGHTHGGIVRLPKLGALYSAEEGLFPEYGGGVYTLDNKATLIVSRGLGDSDKWPRINNVPELSVIDIN